MEADIFELKARLDEILLLMRAGIGRDMYRRWEDDARRKLRRVLGWDDDEEGPD